MKKLILLAGVGLGYVLGAKAGRERYEQIMGTARGVAGNPKVQETVGRAQETVAAQAPHLADTVKEKAGSAASAVREKMSGDHGPHGAEPTQPGSPSTPTSPPLS